MKGPIMQEYFLIPTATLLFFPSIWITNYNAAIKSVLSHTSEMDMTTAHSIHYQTKILTVFETPAQMLKQDVSNWKF